MAQPLRSAQFCDTKRAPVPVLDVFLFGCISMPAQTPDDVLAFVKRYITNKQMALGELVEDEDDDEVCLLPRKDA